MGTGFSYIYVVVRLSAHVCSCTATVWSSLNFQELPKEDAAQEYVIFIMLLRSVIKMLLSMKFVEDNLLTFLILCEKC